MPLVEVGATPVPSREAGVARILNGVRRTIEIVIMGMFLILIAAVFYQVVGRYVFNAPPDWSEELARYLQVWIAMLASALCIHRGWHFGVDYLIHILPRRPQAFFGIVVNLLVSGFLVLLLVTGVRILAVASVQTSPAMGINMWYAYLAIAVGALLMLLESMVKLGGAIAAIRRPA